MSVFAKPNTLYKIATQKRKSDITKTTNFSDYSRHSRGFLSHIKYATAAVKNGPSAQNSVGGSKHGMWAGGGGGISREVAHPSAYCKKLMF